MVARKERISSNGYASLIRGIWQHGLQPASQSAKLMVDMSSLAGNSTDEAPVSALLMSPSEARELAVELVEEYVAVCSDSLNSKISHKVTGELLRVIFRTAAMEAKGVADRNFGTDLPQTQHSQTQDGLFNALEIIEGFRISWDIQTADVLMDECLRVGDIAGVQFVSETMWNKRIWARTTTFNALLHRYADNGDGESAYKLVHEVMQKVMGRQYHDLRSSLIPIPCHSERVDQAERRVLDPAAGGVRQDSPGPRLLRTGHHRPPRRRSHAQGNLGPAAGAVCAVPQALRGGGAGDGGGWGAARRTQRAHHPLGLPKHR